MESAFEFKTELFNPLVSL